MHVTLEQAMEMAIEHHQVGRLAEAEGIYRQVLAQWPNHVQALHLLGILAGQAGHLAAAIDLIGRAIAINPIIAEYHSDLGETYSRLGQWDEAIVSFHQALERKPELAEAHGNLGNALQASGRLDAAIAAYQRAIALKPGSAGIENNLGNALRAKGSLDEAIAAYQRAIVLQPDVATAHNNLGNVLWQKGRLDEAIAAYQRAIALKPDFAEAHSNLGNALKDQRRLDEAIAAFDRAIALKPDHAEAHSNLGNVLWQKGRLDEAITAYRRAIALKPDFAEAHNNLGTALKDQGRLDEAIAAIGRAVELKPDYTEAASNLVLTLHYHPDYDAQAILAAHREWAREHAEPLAAEIRPHGNDRVADRRLRIGYLSPDLRNHPVGQSLLPLFSHHDRRQFEIVCYSDARVADGVTARLKSLSDGWHDTLGLSDPQLADLIRGERIDILVDLALHTAQNRLLVFARKPAPVQVTMFGMPATTGLITIDYRVTDPYLDPPGTTDGDYTEQSIRLPSCFWCYQPPPEALPVGPLPAEKNGFVTLGCLNHFAKVSRPALLLWRNVLQELPEARLVILSQPGSHRETVRRLFEEGGVGSDRLEFVGRVPRHEYFARYHELDLSLDPFPYNGHTSMLDSLWMGVPAVTLAGVTAVGRGGVSILSNLGLPELIAQTPGQYVDRAVAWARDLPRLARLRAGLREQMRSSVLLSGARYAADLEAAYRRMWTT